METITVFKIWHQRSWSLVFDLDDALAIIKDEVGGNYVSDGDPLEYKLEVCEMTQEQIDKLPEFEGY